CLTIIPKEDKAFYPSTFAKYFSYLSLFIFTGLSLILIMARAFNITPFGASSIMFFCQRSGESTPKSEYRLLKQNVTLITEFDP
ncbi:MAG TPA: hypothetical protein QGI39_00460, partial [Gammaproteobacteria bacterium]|nr:hypothetical protein [Gammaproteobacteria bacterium]